MLAAIGFAIVLAGQADIPPSPYLEAVLRYDPGSEAHAIAALWRLRVRNPNQVFEELDDRVCRDAGATSCTPRALVAAGVRARERVAAAWRRLYPRALALHVEALAAGDPGKDQVAMAVHRLIVLRLIVRLEQIAREPDVPDDFVALAQLGRRLLLWTLQYLRDLPGLASTIEVFRDEKVKDPELALARAMLEELRAQPEMVASVVAADIRSSPFGRDNLLAQEEKRRLDAAVKIYRQVLASDPAMAEAHLRVGHLLTRLRRPNEARPHIERVKDLSPDSRQAYLAAIFLADVLERQGRRTEARAAYGVALRHWPVAQVPIVALARLRLLEGNSAAARATLEGIHVERDVSTRSDPWLGYIGGQAWRLPGGLKALQSSFEPLR